MTWDQGIKLIELGIAYEATPGTAEAAPDEYILAEKCDLINERSWDEYRAAGSRSMTFQVPQPHHIKGGIESWAFPETNGLGYLLLGALGDDAVARLATASTSYRHLLTAGNYNPPSFSIWRKTGLQERIGKGCMINSLKIQQSKKSKLYMTADILGMQIATAATFGTAAYVTGESKAFRSGKGAALWDDVLMGNITEFDIAIDNSIDPDTWKVVGFDNPQHMVAGERKVTGSVTVNLIDNTEIEDFWGGSAGPSTLPANIPLDFIWESAIVETINTPTTAIKEGGPGTITMTPSGTLTGGGRAFFEVKITTVGAQDKFRWRRDWGVWSSEINTSATPTVLANGISAAFSAITGGALGDRWSFVIGDIPYRLDIEVPSARIRSFVDDDSGNHLAAKIDFQGTRSSSRYGTSTPFDVRAKLYNTRATVYDT